MIRVFVRQGRGLLVLVALLAIAVAACSSGGPQIPGSTGTGNGGNGGTGGTGGTGQPGAGGLGFASGLSANLNSLDSYKFSWAVTGVDASATAAPSGSDNGVSITGTVINKPAKASLVNDFGVQFITIGTDQWMSIDSGSTWIANTSDPTSVDDMLPTTDYASYFDAYAQTYKQLGTEKKNGVDAVHFQGDMGKLSALLGFGGVADMKADLWIAKTGNYPVSGVFSYTYAVGTSGGTLGYKFDITNVNDPSNKVEKPANITELPS